MSIPSYPVVPVEGIQSSLDGFIQPDPTRPWYTERASVIEYDLASVPGGRIVVELVVDRTKTGPFIPRSITGLMNEGSSPSFGSMLEIRTGSAARNVMNPFFFEINIAPSISNPLLYVPVNYPTQSQYLAEPDFSGLKVRLSNLPVSSDRYEVLCQGTNENGSALDNWRGASPVTLVENYYNSSLFSTNLISAAGSTTLPTSGNKLLRSFEIHIPQNSTLATAGNNRIELINNDISELIWGATPYIPAAIGSVERIYSVRLPSPIACFTGLILSIATAFTAGGVEINGWG